MENFKSIYNQTVSEAVGFLGDFPWENPDCYAHWLAQTFYFTSHSTRLLSLAAARAPLNDNLTHSRFLEHIKEETGHENLALQDLKAMGRDIADYPEFAETKIFYNQQYFMIDRYGPHAFMGWILFLEGVASEVGPQIVEKCQAHHKSHTRFLRVHAEEDQDHIKSAFELIEQTKAEENEMFEFNFVTSAQTYLKMFAKIQQKVGGMNHKRSA